MGFFTAIVFSIYTARAGGLFNRANAIESAIQLTAGAFCAPIVAFHSVGSMWDEKENTCRGLFWILFLVLAFSAMFTWGNGQTVLTICASLVLIGHGLEYRYWKDDSKSGVSDQDQLLPSGQTSECSYGTT